MSTFDAAIGVLIHDEGSALNPSDNGRGPSKWGITLKTYRQDFPNATYDTIAKLGREEAIAYYRKYWWERHQYGLIDDQEVATKLFNLGVNIGPELAIQFAQRAVGVTADGKIGPKTAAAINMRQPAKVLEGIRTAGAQHYNNLVLRRPEYQMYLEGWLARLKA